MLDRVLARVVKFCVQYRFVVVAVAALAAGFATDYAARHFAINTDVSRLLSSDLPWRQRELAYQKAFPQQNESIIAVIDAPVPENSALAAAALVDKLKGDTTHFRSVRNLTGDTFFQRNALLFLDNEALKTRLNKLGAAAPLLRVLAPDRNLRGLAFTLSAGLKGTQRGSYKLDDMSGTLNMAADTVEGSLAGRDAAFSWLNLLNGGPIKTEDARQLVEIVPVLDYSALEPGKAATVAVRQAADAVGMGKDFHAQLRLTGPVPISDGEFASLQEGAALNGILSALIVIAILWLALRSWRTVLAVAITVAVGLAITAALGLWLVGALNPISVAFAVLFVGLGADFAIQYSVRYRAERHDLGELEPALVAAAGNVGTPLTLAAAAAAAGFLSFLPTAYLGLAELGLIAGCGMVVAFVVSLTLLPALLRLAKPPAEQAELGYAKLAAADRFLKRRRVLVVACTSLVALAGLPALVHLKFDFDPLSLRDPKSEAIATLRELAADPRIEPNAAQLLVPAAEVAAARARLTAVPEVESVRSIDSFIPSDQDRKLGAIRAAQRMIEPALHGRQPPPPSDNDRIAALRQAAQDLWFYAGDGTGSGPVAARRLADDLTKLADASADERNKVESAFIRTLGPNIDNLRASLQARRITRENLPAELVQSWIAPNKDVRLEIAQKGDPNDGDAQRAFAKAVLAVEPHATGTAIETYEWGRAILLAFAQAGLFALLAIAALLWIVLRRIGDVLLTLIPLLVAAALTIEICALSGFALNYANIIALPVLLGVGVAFKIYYVLAWRRGETNFLQSSLTRAVFFSAMMTATAFGSLWFSSHPGTSSMGKLLALSLLCTLASAALFQPALMGEPRKAEPTPAESTQRRRFDMSNVRSSISRAWNSDAFNPKTWDRNRHRSE